MISVSVVYWKKYQLNQIRSLVSIQDTNGDETVIQKNKYLWELKYLKNDWKKRRSETNHDYIQIVSRHRHFFLQL